MAVDVAADLHAAHFTILLAMISASANVRVVTNQLSVAADIIFPTHTSQVTLVLSMTVSR